MNMREILHVLVPFVIVCTIAVFVVLRMKHKYKNDTLGKKRNQNAQYLLDSLIPFGMMIGCIIAVLLSLFFQISLLPAISLGAGIGLLVGYFSYEFYSKTGESYE